MVSKTAKELVPQLRELADVVLVVTMVDLKRDLKTVVKKQKPLTGENEAYQVNDRSACMTHLFTGHQHRLIATKIK